MPPLRPLFLEEPDGRTAPAPVSREPLSPLPALPARHRRALELPDVRGVAAALPAPAGAQLPGVRTRAGLRAFRLPQARNMNRRALGSLRRQAFSLWPPRLSGRHISCPS